MVLDFRDKNWPSDLLGLRMDREIRLCFCLSYDKPFIYSLAQSTEDPVLSHMCSDVLLAGENQDLGFILSTCFNVSDFPFYSNYKLFGALFLDQEKF